MATEVGVVRRTLAILEVFTVENARLGLSDMARRLDLPKSTTLRLLRAMATCRYVVQDADSLWRLGSAAASLATRYQFSFDVHSKVEPALRRLSDATGRDVSFFVQEGDRRVRLVRVMYPTATHNPARVGESMPMNKGSAGKVMLAALGRQGPEFEKIRNQGFEVTVGEARSKSASIAVPVFGSRWRLVGALCIGTPASNSAAAELAALAPKLRQAADLLSAALSFNEDSTVQKFDQARSNWHP